MPTMPLAEIIETACLLEATARKPGNVHPGVSFDDLCYEDFVKSARIAGPILAESLTRGVGRCILDTITATAREVGTNTNLGIALLIAPLAAVPDGVAHRDRIDDLLSLINWEETADVYKAIRTAAAGGLGHVDKADIADEPTVSLVEAMRLAQDRDLIAAEYAGGYLVTLEFAVPLLKECENFAENWERDIIGLQLKLMSRKDDSLISRKCGDKVAMIAGCHAGYALRSPAWQSGDWQTATAELDEYLRADGNRRNPGTTADLVAAALFVAIREGLITPPDRAAIHEHAGRVRRGEV